MPEIRDLMPVLALGLMSACHAQARVPGVDKAIAQIGYADPLAACGASGLLRNALADDLAQGRAPEISPKGKCVAKAAHDGSSAAAILLAGVYREAMSQGGQAADGKATHAAALGLDLFGRHIGWLHLAADQGYVPAQLLLAQETDDVASSAMPDMTLALYQAAAQNGNQPALAAIGSAYARGRIPYERLYDLRSWLARQTDPSPPYRQMLRLLDRPAGLALPN